MPKYSYKALDQAGKNIRGEVEAHSLQDANDSLAAKGVIPIRVQEKQRRGSGFTWAHIKRRIAPVKPLDIVLFTKQFSTMMKVGLPIVRLMEILEEQTENAQLQWVIGRMRLKVKEGSSLYDAFREYPNIFSPLYCSMVHAGEVSGNIPDVMTRLIYLVEHETKVKADVRSALQYPIIVLIALGVAFFVLLTFVFPRFVKMFQKANLDLPLPTRICLLLYNLISEHGLLLLGGVVVLLIGLFIFLKTQKGRYVRDVTFLKIPIVGKLLIKSAISRFASIFAILQESGVHILDSFTILTETIGNAALERELNTLSGQLEEGQGISRPLRQAKYFTPMLVNMVATGEETGNLAEMLQEAARHYDVEVEYAINKLIKAIGPFLTILLAVGVAFFALAIYMPMWQLSQMAQ